MTTRLLLPSMLLVAAALGPGCALTPPFRTDGPAASREGVQVAVTRQRCEQIQEADEYGWDLLETTLEIQIRNTTPSPLTVHRDAFRLLGPEGSALKTLTWRAADPLTVDAGQTRAFELRFMTRGGLQCNGEMVLDTGPALASPTGAVKVGTVRFVPWRT